MKEHLKLGNPFAGHATPASVKDWCARQNPTMSVINLFRHAGLDWADYMTEKYHSQLTENEKARLYVATFARGE